MKRTAFEAADLMIARLRPGIKTNTAQH